MTPFDYEFVRRAVKARSGIELAPDSQYLVESRLLPIARKSGFGSLSALVAALREHASEPLMTAVVEAMTTNETFFFRDRTPFESFRKDLMPRLLAARQESRTLRIWCAAASTGQEPYSLAMVLKEMGIQVAGWRIEMLATDLSADVLEKARLGIYSQFEVQRGLPIQLLLKYFTKEGEAWQIAPDIRAMVSFRQLNLLSDLSPLGLFDVIFCRNVLIYFDRETKVALLERLNKVLAADGFLVLGGAETVMGLTDGFKAMPEARGVFVSAGRSPSLAAGGGRRALRLAVADSRS